MTGHIRQPSRTPGVVPGQRTGPYPRDTSGEKRGELDHRCALLWLVVLMGSVSRYRSLVCSGRLQLPESSFPRRSSASLLDDRR